MVSVLSDHYPLLWDLANAYLAVSNFDGLCHFVKIIVEPSQYLVSLFRVLQMQRHALVAIMTREQGNEEASPVVRNLANVVHVIYLQATLVHDDALRFQVLRSHVALWGSSGHLVLE